MGQEAMGLTFRKVNVALERSSRQYFKSTLCIINFKGCFCEVHCTMYNIHDIALLIRHQLYVKYLEHISTFLSVMVRNFMFFQSGKFFLGVEGH